MEVRQITVDEFHEELKAQGVPRIDLAFLCPMCGTVQSAADLIAVGAGSCFDDVEGFLGFSCVGRWKHGRSGWEAARSEPDGNGCDWTLGGLFGMQRLEVVDDHGVRHPRFEPVTPAEAQAHAERHAVAGREAG